MANREGPVLVIGATGQQVSAVVRELLELSATSRSSLWRAGALSAGAPLSNYDAGRVAFDSVAGAAMAEAGVTLLGAVVALVLLAARATAPTEMAAMYQEKSGEAGAPGRLSRLPVPSRLSPSVV